MFRLPIPVEIINGESISSWLTRLALEHGCDPIVLTGWLWPNWRAWTFDLDRGLPNDKLDVIARYTEIDRSSIIEAGLPCSAKCFSTKALPKHGIWPWIQALGVRNRTYRGGIQFCPLCFKQDVLPYYRKSWRFSWVSCCDLHSVRMIDHCPNCSKPVEPHRLQALEANELAQCASCGFDLAESSVTPATADALRLQYLAEAVLNKGVGSINDELISPEKWFDVCRHLLILTRRSASAAPTSALKTAIQAVCPKVSCLSTEYLNLPLELLNVEIRSELMAVLFSLLSNLNQLSQSLADHGAFSTVLIDKKGEIPSPLKFLSRNLPLPPAKAYSQRSSKRKKPRSKTSVLRSWERLKRRYRFE